MSNNVDDTETFADKHFSFLISDFRFEKTAPYYASYEYHFGYRKGEVEIHVCCEAGTSLPHVTLRDHGNLWEIGNKKYPTTYNLTDLEFPEKLKELFSSRNVRLKEIEGYFQTSNLEKDHYKQIYKKLSDDYEKTGRTEIETTIQEYAGIVKRHPEILMGDLSIFPKRDKTKPHIFETVSIMQSDGKMKTVIANRELGSNKFLTWLKSLLN